MTEWSPGPVSRGAQPSRAPPRAGAARARTRASSGSSTTTRRMPRPRPGRRASRPARCSRSMDSATACRRRISAFRDGRLQRVAASPARHSLGVFFEHVTNLLNMRELEDEGKVMALADYAAPIADEENPLARRSFACGTASSRRRGRACAPESARPHPLAVRERAVRLPRAARRRARRASRSRATRFGSPGCAGSRSRAASSRT